MIQTGIDPNCALASFLIEEIRLSRREKYSYQTLANVRLISERPPYLHTYLEI